MSTEWDEPAESTEEEEGDPGFLGGGGIARTVGDDDDAELDEHGDNLQRADDEEL